MGINFKESGDAIVAEKDGSGNWVLYNQDLYSANDPFLKIDEETGETTWMNPLSDGGELPEPIIPAVHNGPLLDIPTYDGYGDVVHPDIYYDSAQWNDYEYWLAYTPYAGASYENPSIACSRDGINWKIPPRLNKDPLVNAPASGHNSDSDIIVVNGTMYYYFREGDGGTEYIKYMASSDGWKNFDITPTVILSNANDDSQFLSPAVIEDGGTYYMWAIDNSVDPPDLVKYEDTSPDFGSASSTTCTVNNVPSGKQIWHLDVTKLSSGYEALITVCDDGVNGGGGVTYLATSSGGDTWDIENEAFLSPSQENWDTDIMYCSTMLVDESKSENYYQVWYSAMDSSPEQRWGIGYTEGFNKHLANVDEREIITPADLIEKKERPDNKERKRMAQAVIESDTGSNAEFYAAGIVHQGQMSTHIEDSATADGNFFRIIGGNGGPIKIYYYDGAFNQILEFSKDSVLSTIAEIQVTDLHITNALTVDGSNVSPDIISDAHHTKPTKQNCRAWLSSASTLTSGADETITFDTISHENNMNFDTTNHEIDIPNDGVYHIKAYIAFANSAVTANAQFWPSIYDVGAATALTYRYQIAPAADYFTATVEDDLELSAGDRIAINLKQTAGDISAMAYESRTFVTCNRVN